MEEAADPAEPAVTTTVLLLCVGGGDAAGLSARLQALAQPPGDVRHDVLAVGWGPVEPAETLLREFAGRCPGARVLLHSRPVTRTEALCAGVAAARSGWILLPDPGDRPLSLPASAPGRGVDCVPLGNGSVLFARDAFARLPRIPGMSRWLPELFSRAGMRVVPAGATTPTPWIRRARVALLCTMAGIAAPAASRA